MRQPAPGATTATAHAARGVNVQKNNARILAHLVEKRNISSKMMGRSGVDLAHLACHEHTAGTLNGEVGVCGRVERAGGWLWVRRGLL